MSGRLEGKVVLVTGAANGIGAAIAACVTAEGAHTVMIDAEDTADAVAGPSGIAKLDIRDPDGWTSLVAEVVDHHGRIDGLVNNAGVNVKYQPLRTPDAEWDRCMEVNLRGAWNGARAVLPQMLAQGGGAIVNIASVHAHQIIPASFPYNVAKHGLIGLTRALAIEHARNGIRVNAISPGYIDTRMCRDWWASTPDPVAARGASEALVPARRIGRADEVGMTAVFLLSDEAPYINAAVIPVDGGGLAQFHE